MSGPRHGKPACRNGGANRHVFNVTISDDALALMTDTCNAEKLNMESFLCRAFMSALSVVKVRFTVIFILHAGG